MFCWGCGMCYVLMAINYLNVTPNYLPNHLFKYMKFEHAIDSIKNGTLWFANPEEWRDPYESYFMDNAYDKAKEPFDFPLEKGKLYACCFSTTPNSEAQWKAYTTGIGIKCQIPTVEFLNELDMLSSDYDVYIGKVVYLKTATLQQPDVPAILNASGFPTTPCDKIRALLLMLCKRIAFQYEAEIRVFLIPKKEENYSKKGIKVNVGLKNIAKRYTISPTDRNVQEVVKEGLKSQLGISNVCCSTLYDSATNNVLNW